MATLNLHNIASIALAYADWIYVYVPILIDYGTLNSNLFANIIYVQSNLTLFN